MTEYYYISTSQFGYPQPEDDYENVTYSKDIGCQTCNVGIEQIKEFRFRGNPKPIKNQIIGLNWVTDQIFVREIVKNIFEKENFKGIKFSVPVFHKNGEPIPSFYQLRIENILDSGLLNSDIGIEICEAPKNKKRLKFLKAIGSNLINSSYCNSTKYNFPIGKPFIFKKEIFESNPDFVRTNEWFGSGGSSNRLILVSKRVKQIIEENNLKGARFEKIELR